MLFSVILLIFSIKKYSSHFKTQAMNHMIQIERAIRSVRNFLLVNEMRYRNKVRLLLDTRIELLTRGRMNRMRQKRRRFRRIVIREDFTRRSKQYIESCLLLLIKARNLQIWLEHLNANRVIRQQTDDFIEELKELIIRLKYNKIKVKEALKR